MSKRQGTAPIEARGEHVQAIIDALEKAGAVVLPVIGPVDLLVGIRGRTYLMQLGAEDRLPAAWRERDMITGQERGGAVVSVKTPLEALAAIGWCQVCGGDSAVPGEGACADCVMERVFGTPRPAAAGA